MNVVNGGWRVVYSLDKVILLIFWVFLGRVNGVNVSFLNIRVCYRIIYSFGFVVFIVRKMVRFSLYVFIYVYILI